MHPSRSKATFFYFHSASPRGYWYGYAPMGAAVAILLVLLFLSSALVGTGCVMAHRLTPEGQRPHLRPWLLSWGIKGLAVPIVVWILMNLGLSWRLQPFMPQVQAARNSGGPWFPDFLHVLGLGLFIVG